MAAQIQPHGIGASRLFGKFLLVLVPVFVICSAFGLSLITEHLAQAAHNQLTSRVGTQSAHIAAALGRHSRAESAAATQDLLSTLLFDPAVQCAEVVSHIDAKVEFKVPQGLGCVGQVAAQQFSLPIGLEGGRLNVRFSTKEIETARQSHREFSLLAMLFGLLVSIGASYIGFRLIIGKPLKTLLLAIQQSNREGEPVSVPVSGSDELSTVIRAYNQMQANLVTEAGRVVEKSAELSAERHRNEALLSKVFQVSPYPFAILNAETGIYHNVNEAWLSTMGYSREQVIGKSAHSLGIWVDAEDRARFTDMLGDLGSVRTYEAKVQTRSGKQLDTLISGEYVEYPGGARIFMVANDVTELKAAEAERQRHHAEILDAKTELEGTNRQLMQRTQQLEAAQVPWFSKSASLHSVN